MAKFVFRLAALKKFRENRLLLARKDLIQIENTLHDLSQALRQAVLDRGDLLGGSNEASVRVLYADLVESETRRIRKLEAEITVVEADRERHARWVTHLGRELKAIEKLEEKKHAAFDLERSLVEKRASDNWVAERWFHKTPEGA